MTTNSNAAAASPDDALSTPGTPIEAFTALLDAAACLYDAAAHRGLETAGTYTDAGGGVHHVCINQHPHLGWRVIDVADDASAVLVASLRDVREGKAAALTYAADYCSGNADAVARGETPTKCVRRPMTMHYKPGGA